MARLSIYSAAAALAVLAGVATVRALPRRSGRCRRKWNSDQQPRRRPPGTDGGSGAAGRWLGLMPPIGMASALSTASQGDLSADPAAPHRCQNKQAAEPTTAALRGVGGRALAPVTDTFMAPKVNNIRVDFCYAYDGRMGPNNPAGGSSWDWMGGVGRFQWTGQHTP